MKVIVARENTLKVPGDLLVVFGLEVEGGEESKTGKRNIKKITIAEFSRITARIDAKLAGWLGKEVQEQDFIGKTDQTVLIHTHNHIPASHVLLVGLGTLEKLTPERLRRAAGTAINKAREAHASKIIFALENEWLAPNFAERAQAVVEGALLANYHFNRYKKHTKEERQEPQQLVLTAENLGATNLLQLNKVINQAQLAAQATIFARDLVNEPAREITPTKLAEIARKIGKSKGMSAEIYNEKQIKKLKMGAFLAVAAGSDEPPYLIHLVYRPSRAVVSGAATKSKSQSQKIPKIVLCGKGITFDSGGLNLKPAMWLEMMKFDMAGAAAILGLFSQLPLLQPAAEVHGIIAATENMPSGKATKPGDIAEACDGHTIEIANTDAEGRMVLADALAWATKTIKPDYMVDIATLTGAALVALGQEVAAVLGSDESVVKRVLDAADSAGEAMWRLPLVEEYKQFLKSPVADLANIAKWRWADTIMGGLFLWEFVGKIPWVHIDIAGPAWVEKQILPYAPFGASGFGVRTLIKFLQKF